MILLKCDRINLRFYIQAIDWLFGLASKGFAMSQVETPMVPANGGWLNLVLS
jgi:hypothetical protein